MISERPDPANKFRFRARLSSFVYAGRGLRWLVREEHNARIHAAASIGAIFTGIILDVSVSDWRWLVSAIAIVWLTEAINTAIEDICDHVCPDFDPAIGRIKDLAAGAVLIASIAAGLIGLMTFLPYLGT